MEFLDEIEVELLRLKYIKKLNNNECSKKLNISKKKTMKLINKINEKLAIEMIKNNETILEKISIDNEEDNIKDMCEFRCAICGKLYKVNYKKEKIICPLCYSSNISNKL